MQPKIDFNQNNPQNSQEAFTVSRFIETLNQRIRPLNARIIGEVGEAKQGPTGHMYFSLKDETNQSVISCAIWKSRYDLFGIALKEGMKIIASGRAEIYPPSGRLSFICETIELAGEGALKKEYERVKKLLESEGMFAAERKREIKRFAKKIGVITSKQGAVIADFLNNLGKFGFEIEMIDSRVEGQTAVGDLLASIRTFKKRKIEVLVIIRGGGSLEAMMAFNNEIVVREICAFPVPVIAGIGHHRDIPLATMAADHSVSTPTAAAMLLNRSWEEAERQIAFYQSGIINAYRTRLNRSWIEVSRAASIFGGFKFMLKEATAFLKETLIKMKTLVKLQIEGSKQHLEYMEKIITLNDPERQLELGYGIIRSKGKIVKSIKNVSVGEEIDISVSDGTINSQVKIIKTHAPKQKKGT